MNIVFVCPHCKVEADIDHYIKHGFTGKGYRVMSYYIGEEGVIEQKLWITQQVEIQWLLDDLNNLSPHGSKRYLAGLGEEV